MLRAVLAPQCSDFYRSFIDYSTEATSVSPNRIFGQMVHSRSQTDWEDQAAGITAHPTH